MIYATFPFSIYMTSVCLTNITITLFKFVYNLAALYEAGAYKHLYSEEDVKNLKWLEIFQ